MRICFTLVCCFLLHQLTAQQTTIAYELNGRPSNQAIQDSLGMSQNPFARFVGEWTLKEDTWIQNWGGGDDTIRIPQHHTVCAQLNTDHSLLSIIDGPAPNGHIFWTYNPNTQEISHLSSFGTIRIGKGGGEFYGDRNLRLTVSFEGEAPETYRIYTYEWLSEDEYALNSVQYDANDQPTGLFYKGNFVRIHPPKNLIQEIEAILDTLDNYQLPKQTQISVYTENVIHMAPNHEVIDHKDDLLVYLEEQAAYGYADMKHRMLEVSEHGDVVIMRGEVEGTFYPSNGEAGIPFLTKNLFVFERVRGALKISKVIYNMSPRGE